MDKIQWIEKLKELESGFVWDGNKATRFLTKEEMCLAQSFVEKETLAQFKFSVASPRGANQKMVQHDTG